MDLLIFFLWFLFCPLPENTGTLKLECWSLKRYMGEQPRTKTFPNPQLCCEIYLATVETGAEGILCSWCSTGQRGQVAVNMLGWPQS